MLKRILKGRKSGTSDVSSSGMTVSTSVPTPAAAPGQPVLTAIDRLGEAESLLTLRRDLLEKKVAAELVRAKALTQQGNKRAALAALRKKRLYEQQLEQVETNLLRLSEQQVSLEGISATAETLSAMQAGARAGKAATAVLGVDKVDGLLEELADQADEMRQVQDALGQPVGAAADVDEDDITAELEELEAAQLEEARLQAAPAPAHKLPQQAAPALPSTPAAAQPRALRPVVRPRTAEEEELEAMQAEMAA